MLSIANRLAMLFGAITLGVIALIYVYVVPPLESALRNQRLDSLAVTAKQSVGQVRSAYPPADASRPGRVDSGSTAGSPASR